MGLYQDLRPKTLAEVIGQAATVAQLQEMFFRGSIPHCILFSGPSGTGKTTLARIVAGAIGATDIDIIEKNAASENGVDMVRSIGDRLHQKSFTGNARVYVIDEVHAVTPQGQRAFLKILEDTPAHVYFIFCTTNPEKLEKPFINRCTHFKLGAVPLDRIKALVEQVSPSIPGADAMRIAAAAEGSPRRALVMLEQYLASSKHLDQILDSSDEVSEDLFQLVKDLYAGKNVLKTYSAALKELDNDQLERLRCTIMSYGSSMMLGNGAKDSTAKVMEQFVQPFFSSKKPGFILAIYKALT